MDVLEEFDVGAELVFFLDFVFDDLHVLHGDVGFLFVNFAVEVVYLE